LIIPNSSSCSCPVKPKRTLFVLAVIVVGSFGWLKLETAIP
jgi:hypothetical protein